jgi:hypothetical protein
LFAEFDLYTASLSGGLERERNVLRRFAGYAVEMLRGRRWLRFVAVAGALALVPVAVGADMTRGFDVFRIRR